MFLKVVLIFFSLYLIVPYKIKQTIQKNYIQVIITKLNTINPLNDLKRFQTSVVRKKPRALFLATLYTILTLNVTSVHCSPSLRNHLSFRLSGCKVIQQIWKSEIDTWYLNTDSIKINRPNHNICIFDRRPFMYNKIFFINSYRSL